ncbi:hypothetical protein Tco_0658244 [Tanacetum coccineum]
MFLRLRKRDLKWSASGFLATLILEYLCRIKGIFCYFISAEAEYIAAYDASKEAVWVRKFISGLGVVPTIEEPNKTMEKKRGSLFESFLELSNHWNAYEMLKSWWEGKMLLEMVGIYCGSEGKRCVERFGSVFEEF